jgi:hypothetical protein
MLNQDKLFDDQEAIANEVKILLLNIQAEQDHDDIVRVLIEFHLYQHLIELLQHTNSYWNFEN